VTAPPAALSSRRVAAAETGLKHVFSLHIGVETALQILDIPVKYACGSQLGFALI
jgi:hypothetical protein